MQTHPRVNAVDLFCGAGGLTRGLLDAGVAVKSGVDIDDDCRYPYEVNNGVPFRSRDVADLEGKEVGTWLGEGLSVLAGCAPCQPFSILTNGKDRSNNPQSSLLGQFGRLVHEVRPDYVTMENVPGIASTDVFDSFLTTLEDKGYHVEWSVADCNAFGVPQTRRRVVLIASLVGPAPRLRRRPGRRPTSGPVLRVTSRLGAGAEDPQDRLHRAPRLSETNLRRMKASKPGGTWRDWPEELVVRCHAKSSGASFDQAYGRIDPARPAPTVTTKFFNYGSGRFGHPTDHRAITPREAAMLQTFPPSYQFEDPTEPLTLTDLGRLIGNAVPVALGRAVGDAILHHASTSVHQE